MRTLAALIHRIENPTRVAKEDVWDQLKQYWDNVTNGYWNDVDDDLADELGVTPTALAELLEVHRHTYEYGNVGGNSGVRGYDHGEDWMVVMFADGSRYLYTLKSTDRNTLDYMRQLATAGKGLNSYLTRIVGSGYAGRNYKGTITIKPGMEQFNPDGYKRLQLIIAFHNTLTKTSNEAFMRETLTKYKEQIDDAGQDGLDPTARQMLSVGLESMGITTQVSNESIDGERTLSETATLEALVEKELERL